MRKRQDGRSADRGGVENGQGHSFFSRCPRLAPVVEGFHALPTPQVGTDPKGKLAHLRQVHWHVRQTRDLDLRNYPVRQSFTCKSVAGPWRSRTAHLDLFSLMRLHRQGPRLARQARVTFTCLPWPSPRARTLALPGVTTYLSGQTIVLFLDDLPA